MAPPKPVNVPIYATINAHDHTEISRVNLKFPEFSLVFQN